MPAVHSWTGREARALRQASRQSVRGFAEHLGVAPRTVSKWEQLGQATRPHPDTQAILDTALERRSTAVAGAFPAAAHRGRHRSLRRILAAVPPAWDYETWTDDLDRAVAALSRQDFAAGTRLLERWLGRFPAGRLDNRGLYLHARSLVLLGDAHRDQGRLEGPLSATQAYRRALAMFTDAGRSPPRRADRVVADRGRRDDRPVAAGRPALRAAC